MEPAQVVQEILDSGLRGRGGAFFPTGRKASFLAKGTGKPTYLVVNADESEPGTFKDREIMFTVPHRLIEGCLITAHAIECDRVFIYIRGEYLREFEILRDALEEVHKAKLLGGVTIVLHRGAGAYICGEETALLESLEGKRGQPRTKPPFPAVAGLYASPSLINNVETIATVPKIVELGAKEYAKIGVPPDSSGTRVFSLSGNVVNGGNYELPMGVTLRELIYDHRRRDPERAAAEGRHPGRLLGAGPDRRPDRRPARRRPRWPRPARCSAPARSSSSTTAAAWCSSASASRSSTCTRAAASARRAARARAGWCRS